MIGDSEYVVHEAEVTNETLGQSFDWARWKDDPETRNNDIELLRKKGIVADIDLWRSIRETSEEQQRMGKEFSKSPEGLWLDKDGQSVQLLADETETLQNRFLQLPQDLQNQIDPDSLTYRYLRIRKNIQPEEALLGLPESEQLIIEDYPQLIGLMSDAAIAREALSHGQIYTRANNTVSIRPAENITEVAGKDCIVREFAEQLPTGIKGRKPFPPMKLQ